MASTRYTILFSLLFFSMNFIAIINCNQFSRKMSQEEIQKMEIRTHTHLHFYFHDVFNGSSAIVAQAPNITNSSVTKFGQVVVADNALTLGPNNDSKIVGRAQGMYTSADNKEFGLLMLLNFVFAEGEFNGSTLSVVGRNAILLPVREMPVVGGSGIFRHAQGYAEAMTYALNLGSDNAIVEYNVYVSH